MNRLLLIDDDEDIVAALADHLSESYDVDTAGDGVEGLARAADRPPDAIILDVMMPVMDGLTFLRELRATGAATPVIIISASRHLPPGYDHLDCDEFLTKPFDLTELESALERAIERGRSP